MNISLQIEIQDEVDDKIIRARIKSRHSGSVQYWTWIQFDDRDIKAWYCSCRSGARVVGCCAHETCVIWFLGYARHHTLSGRRRRGSLLLDAREAASDAEASDSD